MTSPQPALVFASCSPHGDVAGVSERASGGLVSVIHAAGIYWCRRGPHNRAHRTEEVPTTENTASAGEVLITEHTQSLSGNLPGLNPA